MLVQRIQRVTRGPAVPVPRFATANGAKSGGTVLAQPDSELVNGERMSIAMLVGVLDIASVQQLTDYVFWPIGLARAEQAPGS